MYGKQDVPENAENAAEPGEEEAEAGERSGKKRKKSKNKDKEREKGEEKKPAGKTRSSYQLMNDLRKVLNSNQSYFTSGRSIYVERVCVSFLTMGNVCLRLSCVCEIVASSCFFLICAS